MLITFGLLGMLQVGYLGGALVGGAWTGTPASPVDVSADTAVTPGDAAKIAIAVATSTSNTLRSLSTVLPLEISALAPNPCFAAS